MCFTSNENLHNCSSFFQIQSYLIWKPHIITCTVEKYAQNKATHYFHKERSGGVMTSSGNISLYMPCNSMFPCKFNFQKSLLRCRHKTIPNAFGLEPKNFTSQNTIIHVLSLLVSKSFPPNHAF